MAQLPSLILSTAKQFQLGEVHTLRKARGGTTHLVYHVGADQGDYALRVARLSEESGGSGPLQRKERLWHAVGRWGIGPAYHGGVCTEVAGVPVFVGCFDWIDGRRFDPLRDAESLARTLARSHSRGEQHVSPRERPVDYGRFLRSRLRVAAARPVRTPLEKLLQGESRRGLASLSRLRYSTTESPALVHGDLVDQNLLTVDKRVYLIDWDWAVWTTPAIDLYCFLSPFVRGWESPSHVPEAAALRFLSAYVSERDSRTVQKLLHRDHVLWVPYNVMLADWLYHECPRQAVHRHSLAFYQKGLANVERLDSLIWLLGRQTPPMR